MHTLITKRKEIRSFIKEINCHMLIFLCYFCMFVIVYTFPYTDNETEKSKVNPSVIRIAPMEMISTILVIELHVAC